MTTQAIPEEVLDRMRAKDGTTRIAVVGASNNPDKYGNVIVKTLVRRGYSVLPINPKEPSIEGLAAYPSVAAAPGPIHIVDFVTPPDVTRAAIERLDPASVEAVWFQDGSFDAALVERARERFDRVVAGQCIMVVAGWAV